LPRIRSDAIVIPGVLAGATRLRREANQAQN
jgi:hypothetical protein